ncbi:hypothetical protein OAU52_01160 [bacterium]|nr:hypothetical protein [bacterium]
MKKRKFIRFKPQQPTVIQIKFNFKNSKQSNFIPTIVIDQNHNSKSCLVHVENLSFDSIDSLFWNEEGDLTTKCEVIRIVELDKQSYRLVFSF